MYKGFFHPFQTDKMIEVIKKSVQERKLNIGLFLDKYVLWWETKEGELKCSPEVQISILRNPDRTKTLIKNPNIQDKKFRDEITKNVKLSIPLTFSPKDGNKDYYKLYENKINHLFSTLKSTGFYVEHLPNEQSGLSLNWRLIINLGAASVYETSLLFHRNYSIPYIPGSAVKGVTKHRAILKLFEECYAKNIEEHLKEIYCIEKILETSTEKDINFSFDNFQEKFKVKKDGEEIAPSKQLYEFFKQKYAKINCIQQIFGTQDKKGKVIFFDALPVIEDNQEIIVLDVMNVHYKPYYEKGEAPGDWHSPTPIFFLVVEKGTKFRFALASKEKELVQKARKLLKEALNKIGIGAKTSAGYGYFEVK